MNQRADVNLLLMKTFSGWWQMMFMAHIENVLICDTVTLQKKSILMGHCHRLINKFCLSCFGRWVICEVLQHEGQGTITSINLLHTFIYSIVIDTTYIIYCSQHRMAYTIPVHVTQTEDGECYRLEPLIRNASPLGSEHLTPVSPIPLQEPRPLTDFGISQITMYNIARSLMALYIGIICCDSAKRLGVEVITSRHVDVHLNSIYTHYHHHSVLVVVTFQCWLSLDLLQHCTERKVPLWPCCNDFINISCGRQRKTRRPGNQQSSVRKLLEG